MTDTSDTSDRGASGTLEPHCEDDIYGPCGCPDRAFCCLERDQYGECGHVDRTDS